MKMEKIRLKEKLLETNKYCIIFKNLIQFIVPFISLNFDYRCDFWGIFGNHVIRLRMTKTSSKIVYQ